MARKEINTRRKRSKRRPLSFHQRGRCYWCGQDIEAAGLQATLDHLLNCDVCNNLRGDEWIYDFKVNVDARLAWEGSLI